MAVMPFNRVCLAGVGDDLYVARVSGSGWRIRARRGPVVRGFLRMNPEEARRALGDAGAAVGTSGRVVLTLPSGTCGVRPMQLGMSRWHGARAEVTRAIGRLFPIDPDEALVGLVSRRAGASLAETPGSGGEGGSVERGYLVVASRREVGAWTDRLERALGREVSEVLSTQMAMLGLGLQHESRAGVIERAASGAEEIHWLRYGEVEELGAPWAGEMDDTTEVSGAVLRRLPGAEAGDPADDIDGHELAIAGGLASIAGGGAFAPLVGKPAPAPKRWVAPLAGVAAAALLLWGGSVVLERRYERAIVDLRAQDGAIAERLARIEATRAELSRTTAMIEGAIGKTVAGWKSVMPELAAAHAVIPDDAFLYDLRLDGRRVVLRGEAPRASDVLRNLESSEAFTSPTRQSPTQVVQERGTETFDLAATRKDGAPKAGTQPGSTSSGGRP